MYLLGAMKALTEGILFRSFKTYGLLLIRNELSIGVELKVGSQGASVDILWLNTDMNRLEPELYKKSSPVDSGYSIVPYNAVLWIKASKYFLSIIEIIVT